MFQRGTLARILGTAIAIAVSGSADLEAERVPFRTYTASDGLAHDRVRCVLADSRGFLWFCTVDGLSRFDGSRFINYGPEHGLPHPAVEEIVEAGPGVYWIATAGGLARLRSDSEPSPQVDTAQPDAVNSPGEGPPTLALTVYSLGRDAAANDVVTMKKDRAGRIWIGTSGGLFVLEHPLRRAELSSRRAGSLERSIPVQASASACRGPGRHAVDRHIVRPLSAASRRTDYPRTHGPGCRRRTPSARRSAWSHLDRPRLRAEPCGSHCAFSITECVAVDSHRNPALSGGSTWYQPPHGRLAKPADSRRSRN